jgi:anti-sigma-K factor RskA
MTHSEMDELYELYLMGVLEFAQASEISDHLSRDCEHCSGRLRESSALLAALGTCVEPSAPPPQLRERVLAIAGKSSALLSVTKSSKWLLAFALATAATVALLFWGFNERGNLQRVRQQLQEVSRQRNELRATLAILGEADTRTVKFGAIENQPHGQVFVSRTGGVVFLGSRLPELASGKTFEFWLVPAKGNPQAAGLFRTNAQGIAVNVLAQSINPGDYAAVAVSIEPEGGSPQPSSKPILVVPLV